MSATGRRRIAFFDYADVFEDFYAHYCGDQQTFGTSWAATSNHAFLRVLQEAVGDVRWFELAIRPGVPTLFRHDLGFDVQFVRSSLGHRSLWKAFYGPRCSWRWQGAYRPYATVASYLAPLSPSLAVQLRQWRPDVIFAQSYSSGRFDVLLAISRALGVPLVAYHAGGAPDGYLGSRVRARTLRHADLLIASSKVERELLVGGFHVPPERTEVILTPIDLETFRVLPRVEACAAAGLDPRRKYVLFVGRLSEHEKRVGALLHAFSRVVEQVPDAELLIVGEGRDGDELRARASDRVRFLGWVAGPRLAALYAAAECLALPSRREGFPTVVGEAMACGTPVVATRVGGVPELVVDGGTGWLIAPGDDDALADRLLRALGTRDEGMRTAARRLAEARLSPKLVGVQLRESIGALLG